MMIMPADGSDDDDDEDEDDTDDDEEDGQLMPFVMAL